MDKGQALHTFWNSFGVKAYDEGTVPEGEFAPSFPYITYTVVEGVLDEPVTLSASIWDRSNSWANVERIANEVSRALYMNGTIALDNGRLMLYRGTPFASRMTDPDDSIRRIYLNVGAEFLTAY